MYLSIYLYIYVFIYLFISFTLVYFFIFALCGLAELRVQIHEAEAQHSLRNENELGIFSFNLYLYYLTRSFIA